MKLFSTLDASPVSTNHVHKSQSQTLIQSPKSLWNDLFTNPQKQRTFPSPSYLDDGTPLVLAPPDIILKASASWDGYLITHFFGEALHPDKTFKDLNPIWGKLSPISVCKISNNSCLILIPSLRIRQWVLHVGLWFAGTVAFSVFNWSISPRLLSHFLSAAPLWVMVKLVPPQLWSDKGIELIVSGIGEVIPRNPPRKLTNGDARLKVLVNLLRPVPSVVAVQDSHGDIVRVETYVE